MPPSERRFGRSEEQQKIFNIMLRKASHDLNLLMGILMTDDQKKPIEVNHSHNRRQRKQGTFVRHPVDLVDVSNRKQEQSSEETQQPQRKLASTHSNENNSVDETPSLRKGSLTNSIISRKSSSRSIGSNRSRKTNRSGTTIRSNITITSTGSYVKKNSGNFDGGNTKTKSRRKNSLHRRSSAKVIADFYKELEELEELSSSDDSSDDGEKPAKKIPVEEIKSHQRVEEYLMNLQAGEPQSDEDEGIISDTTKSDLASEPDDKMNEKCGKRQLTGRYPEPESMNISPLQKDRKYIPRPPLNMTTNYESLSFDHNENRLQKTTNHKKSHRMRSLPTKPRGITIVDKDLQERFKNKENLRDEVRTNDELRQSFRKRDLGFRQSFRKKETFKDDFYRNNDERSSYRKANNHYRISTSKTDHHRIPTKKELLFDNGSDISCSSDSANGSTRSISSVSSISVSQHRGSHQMSPKNAVPKNFIPGQTKRREKQRRNHSTQERVRTASFCFKGITCSVQSNAPRTYKALAHAGCIGLVIPGPPNHKCTQ